MSSENTTLLAGLRKDIADDAIDVHGPHGFCLGLRVEGDKVYLLEMCNQVLGELGWLGGELLDDSAFTEWVVMEYGRLTITREGEGNGKPSQA